MLLADSVTVTRPAKDWWYTDSMDSMKQKNVAVEMAENKCSSSKKKVILTSGVPHCVKFIPESCQDLRISQQGTNSGVFTISPQGTRTFQVYCDFDSNKVPWTVIQRRIDDDVNFDRPWVDYKTGFGNLTGSFWLGNDNIHNLLSAGHYTLKIVLEKSYGTKTRAAYSTFYVAGEDEKYKLTVQGYSGEAGDGLENLNNMMFSTKDSDNDNEDGSNCAQKYSGGWWFKSCYVQSGFLNGKYLSGNEWYKTTWFPVKNICMKVRKT